MKKCFSVLFVALAALLCCGCADGGADGKPMLGVWWWDSGLSAETYLSFAEDNGVTEIYYCDDGFDGDTENFIKNAAERDIKVYWLSGKYEWLRDDKPLYRLIEKYNNFQNSAVYRYAGIHLDIEPHQDPQFENEREYLLERLVSVVYGLSRKYPDIKFDYDIPFWIHDDIRFNGKVLPAYAHIIDNSDRTFIMSYRDSAQAVYDTAKDEVGYAVSVGKVLALGVETYSEEGDNVSFMEEGKNYMYGEIKKIRTMLPKDFGISIHQIKTWHGLQE